MKNPPIIEDKSRPLTLKEVLDCLTRLNANLVLTNGFCIDESSYTSGKLKFVFKENMKVTNIVSFICEYISSSMYGFKTSLNDECFIQAVPHSEVFIVLNYTNLIEILEG